MTWTNFIEKWETAQEKKQSDLALVINPQLEQLPLPITRFDDPFFPFAKAIINATERITCAYIFDFASYLAMGAAGIVALERSLGYVPKNTLKILHGPFASDAYSPMADAISFALDALTLSDDTHLTHYITHPPFAALAMNTEIVPDEGGLIDFVANIMQAKSSTGEIMTIRLAREDVLYASRLDNFAIDASHALEKLR